MPATDHKFATPPSRDQESKITNEATAAQSQAFLSHFLKFKTFHKDSLNTLKMKYWQRKLPVNAFSIPKQIAQLELPVMIFIPLNL